ncbi:MAG: hypothetical protein A2052_01940 [Deltaproteobacteria bacterium GWA2_54_12]|nr:MAG: hypothetical protein A2052_01940 [Deltaproteobacteria bacterium GWA2_54_12]
MKTKMILLLIVFSLGLWPAVVRAETSTKSSNGVKAVLKTDPAKKMVDLFLSELPGGKEITDAKVTASVTFPDGRKVEKDLIGMKMGEAYSFMNSLDMSKPGRYSFDIAIKKSGKSIKFEFIQNIP